MAEHLLDVGTAPLPARSAALTTGDCSTHTPKGIRARPTLQGSFFARMCALRWSPFRPRRCRPVFGRVPRAVRQRPAGPRPNRSAARGAAKDLPARCLSVPTAHRGRLWHDRPCARAANLGATALLTTSFAGSGQANEHALTGAAKPGGVPCSACGPVGLRLVSDMTASFAQIAPSAPPTWRTSHSVPRMKGRPMSLMCSISSLALLATSASVMTRSE